MTQCILTKVETLKDFKQWFFYQYKNHEVAIDMSRNLWFVCRLIKNSNT